MRMTNTESRYGWMHWLAHWTSVLLVSLVILVALSAGAAQDGALRASFAARHVFLGHILLGVMCARLVWRLVNPNPLGHRTMPHRHRVAIVAMHWGLYLLVITECLLGVAWQGLTHAGGPLPAAADALAERVGPAAIPWHEGLAYPIYLLVVVHALSAVTSRLTTLDADA